MRILAATFCLAAVLLVTPTLAQQSKPPTLAQTTQQQRMSSCNPEASQRELKGDAWQTYISACLGGKMSQTTLMKLCDTQVSQDELASDNRKIYVSSCLKKSG